MKKKILIYANDIDDIEECLNNITDNLNTNGVGTISSSSYLDVWDIQMPDVEDVEISVRALSSLYSYSALNHKPLGDMFRKYTHFVKGDSYGLNNYLTRLGLVCLDDETELLKILLQHEPDKLTDSELVGILGEILADENDINGRAYEAINIVYDALVAREEKLNISDDCPNSETTEQNDPVSHPSHYTQGNIEVIDFIEDQKLGYHLGNAVKYICRCGRKDPNKWAEDLEKAKWYINRYIEQHGE